LLALCEVAARRYRVSPESSRKLAHLSCGVFAAFLPLFMSFPSVIVVAALFVPFMIVSRRIGIFPAVHSVERSTLGEIYFPLGVGLVAALFPVRAPYAYGVLVMGISDALASLAGRRWGRSEYSVLRAHKTYLGSAVFFVSTLGLTAAALGVSGPFSPVSVAAAVGLAGALTVVEGVLAGGIDNAMLPVAGAALLVMAT
jgi:phytol kinase